MMYIDKLFAISYKFLTKKSTDEKEREGIIRPITLEIGRMMLY